MLTVFILSRLVSSIVAYWLQLGDRRIRMDHALTRLEEIGSVIRTVIIST